MVLVQRIFEGKCKVEENGILCLEENCPAHNGGFTKGSRGSGPSFPQTLIYTYTYIFIIIYIIHYTQGLTQ